MVVGVPPQTSPALRPAMHLELPLAAVHFAFDSINYGKIKNDPKVVSHFGGGGACQDNPRHFVYSMNSIFL